MSAVTYVMSDSCTYSPKIMVQGSGSLFLFIAYNVTSQCSTPFMLHSGRLHSVWCHSVAAVPLGKHNNFPVLLLQGALHKRHLYYIMLLRRVSQVLTGKLGAGG